MPLQVGARLGPYEVLGLLGAGGMGEVYRARDTKLNRDVAIKVVLDAFAADPERVARFQREAQLLAALNHPQIGAIYGLEQADGSHFLVLELVEGETLADRLSRGPLTVEAALRIAIQIAAALEAAHEKGVVHRDLKPANVKITPDEQVKVLDFGLAKAVEPSGAASNASPTAAGLTQSPTLSVMATQAGMILGTAAYMSPEQAKGLSADHRSDVFSFGVVFYEMLTGRQPFQGETAPDVLASVLVREPDLSVVPPNLNPRIVDMLKRCLDKNPKRRWQAVGDLRAEIEAVAAAPRHVPALAQTVAPQALWKRLALYSMPALLAGAVITGGAVWVATRPGPAQIVAFTVETAAAARPDSFAISPDGRQLAFAALDTDGQQRLWLRSFDSTAVRVLPGTEQAASPFWSPDSRTVAFFTNNELKRIDVAGGAAQTICKTPGNNAVGGTWNDQQVVLFARNGATGIFRVPAAGGDPQQVTKVNLGARENNHAFPQFLPDGRHFLYLKVMAPAAESALIWRSLDSPDERVVRKMYSKAFYSPTGHLVFRLGGPVVAQPFDPSTGTVSGNPVQIAGDTWSNGALQVALALSPAGVLAHRAGEARAVAQLTWFDRDGRVLSTVGTAADYRNATIDPAGERVAANTVGAPVTDVWLLDSRRGTTSRITFDPAADSDPLFSPDGKSIVFYSARQPAGIYRKASNGAGADELVAATGLATYPRDWSSDGRFLLYDSGENVGALWALPMDGDRKPARYPPAQSTTFRVFQGHFAPDNRWVAYVSDETGRQEIFVQDFPATGAKFQVSVMGGSEPRWRRDGRELTFLAPDGRLMSVGVETKPDFRLGVPKPLFQTRLMNLGIAASRRYAVSADGTRFLMNVPVGGDSLPPITVVLNWQNELKQTAALKK